MAVEEGECFPEQVSICRVCIKSEICILSFLDGCFKSLIVWNKSGCRKRYVSACAFCVLTFGLQRRLQQQSNGIWKYLFSPYE